MVRIVSYLAFFGFASALQLQADQAVDPASTANRPASLSKLDQVLATIPEDSVPEDMSTDGKEIQTLRMPATNSMVSTVKAEDKASHREMEVLMAIAIPSFFFWYMFFQYLLAADRDSTTHILEFN